MTIDPEKLKKFLNIMVNDPSLKMLADGTTFCNLGIHRAGDLYANEEFKGLMARNIIDQIEKEEGWLIVSGTQATDYAMRGGWAIAYMKIYQLDANGKPSKFPAKHDHVATVYPGPMEMSASLGREVPRVANVGRKNAVMRSSEAFPVAQGEAEYAIFI